jgi:hypothetical protein
MFIVIPPKLPTAEPNKNTSTTRSKASVATIKNSIFAQHDDFARMGKSYEEKIHLVWLGYCVDSIRMLAGDAVGLEATIETPQPILLP